MDKRKCSMCRTVFDYDTSGLGTEREGKEVVFCGAKCVKKSTAERGTSYAIHDEADAIVDTDV